MKKKLSGAFGIYCISALSAIFFIAFLWWKTPFLLDNDNIYLKTIVSGEMTGTPEPRMLYMGILSGGVLSLLYRITGNGIPWFGLFLCLSMALPMILLMGTSLERCRSIWTGAILWGFWNLTFLYAFYVYFARTQYTIATGMVGAAALLALALISGKESLKDYLKGSIPFLVLAVWGMGMREEAFLMLLPFFGLCFLTKLLEGRRTGTGAGRNVVILGCLFGALILAVLGANRAATSSREWRDYLEYDDLRSRIVDYGGYPDYETHRDLYESVGITESSYRAMTGHYNYLLDPNINLESLRTIEKVAVAERKAGEAAFVDKLRAVLREIYRMNWEETQDRPLNRMVFFGYLCVLVLAAVRLDLRAVRSEIFLIIARMTDWIYLVWNGRYPFRVTQIIYLAELVGLVAIVLNHRLWERRPDRRIWKKLTLQPLILALLVGVPLVGDHYGRPGLRYQYNFVKSMKEMSVCFTELEDYLEQHPENFYFFDMSHLYYMEDTLAFETSPAENYIYMGSWMVNSPWYEHKLAEAGITDPGDALIHRDNVYLLYQVVDFDTRDFLDDFYADHYPGTELRLVETFTSSNGFVYEILKAYEIP